MAVTTLIEQDTVLDATLALWPAHESLPVFNRNNVTAKWFSSNTGSLQANASTLLPGLLEFARNEQAIVGGGGNGGIYTNYAVAVASTAALTLSGEQTIDGVLTSASRILVKNQADAATNGIYVTAAGAWARATDYNQAAEIQNSLVSVSGGTVGANTQWLQPLGTVVVGTTNLAFSQYQASNVWTRLIAYLVTALA